MNLDAAMLVDRRGLLAQALMLAGAGAAAAACTALVPLPAAAQDRVAPRQMAVLCAVADLMLPRTDTPSALDVGVPALFEALLVNWAGPQTRAVLLGVLDAIDGLAGPGAGFAALPVDEQMRLLVVHDTAALSPVDGPRANPFGPAPVADPAYQRFKQLVLTLYYYSQPGATQELGYVHVPGRWRPSVPVTDTIRPMGGPGMF